MPNNEILTIDPSMGSCLDNCPREFYWSFVRGVVPIETPSYFVSGSAWDSAKHALFASKSKSGFSPESIAEAHRAISKEYLERGPVIDPKRSEENLHCLLDLFIDRCAELPYEIIESNIGFKFPYKDFFLAGELDCYAIYKNIGTMVVEDKTTIIVPSSKGFTKYIDSFKIGRYANQLFHYQWAVSQLTQCEGSIIEIACLDIPKRESTIREQFTRRIIPINYQKIHSYLDLCEWRINKIRYFQKSKKFPCEGQHCTGAYGLKACTFLPLCSSGMDENTPDELIPSNLYKTGLRWEPWNGIKRDVIKTHEKEYKK